MSDKKYHLRFSEESTARLKEAIIELQKSLATQHTTYYHDYLNKILNSAQQKNTHNFQSLVLSNELFGGSGALWEIFFDDPIQDKKFNQKILKFIDSLEELGIDDVRVQQVKEGLNLTINEREKRSD